MHTSSVHGLRFWSQAPVPGESGGVKSPRIPDSLPVSEHLLVRHFMLNHVCRICECQYQSHFSLFFHRRFYFCRVVNRDQGRFGQPLLLWLKRHKCRIVYRWFLTLQDVVGKIPLVYASFKSRERFSSTCYY